MKNIFIILLLLLISVDQSVQANQQIINSIPIAISCNFGIPALMGCQSGNSNPQFDCGIHKFGIAPGNKEKNVLLGTTLSNYSAKGGNELYYTTYHTNGYYTASNLLFTFIKLQSQQPFKDKNVSTMGSGFNIQNYTYTLADIIFFAQNIHLGSGIARKVFKDRVITSDYTQYNAAITEEMIQCLMKDVYFYYSGSFGNYIGGPLEQPITKEKPLMFNVKNTKAMGMTELQNYVFDGFASYCVYFISNNLDLIVWDQDLYNIKMQKSDINTLANNDPNLFLECSYAMFANALSQNSLQINDYFNTADSQTGLLYIPLHFADPGTTYNGCVS